MSHLLESLNWRYATKQYDATKKINIADLETLLEATRLSVSSYGLQPYKVLIVENPELRAQLRAVAWNQSAITDASHLFIFAVEKNLGDKQVQAYMENISQTRGIPVEALQGFSGMIHNAIDGLDENAKQNWAKKQAYIALSTFINTAAYLKLDATPKEGFDAQKFDEILGLDALGLTSAVVATVGYRHEEDAAQHYKKVRKSNQDLFINL